MGIQKPSLYPQYFNQRRKRMGRHKKEIASIKSAIKQKTKEEKDLIRYPTGSDLQDLLVGGGLGMGYPGGKIINIVGDKSTGKTFLACELIAAAYNLYKEKLKWIYDDCESGFSFNTTQLYGFEIMPMQITKRNRSKTIEDAYCNIRNFLEENINDYYSIYVIDSLDGLTSEEGNELANERYKLYQTDKKMEKGSYKMGKPKYLSNEFFPQLANLLQDKNALLVIISQVRTNIDPFSFEKYTRAGGKAMDFYCHTVLWLAQINKLLKKGRAVGVTIKAKNTKSKTPRPYREIFVQLVFDYGLDNISSNIDFYFDLLTPKGKLIASPKVHWDCICSIIEIKEFLAENKKENYYRKNVCPKLKRSEVMAWLCIPENELLLSKFNKKYNIEMTRNELISYIEANNLQKQLTEKVVKKWEVIENSIKSHRPKKYS